MVAIITCSISLTASSLSTSTVNSPVAGSSQFNLAFFNFRGYHISPPETWAQDPGCFIFMVDSIIFFPYIELVFSHTQKNGDIFLCDNMPFPEPGAFGDPFDDLGQVMDRVPVLPHLLYVLTYIYKPPFCERHRWGYETLSRIKPSLLFLSWLYSSCRILAYYRT